MTLFRRFAMLALVILALISMLGVGPTSAEIAINIVTVGLMVVTPFVGLAHIHLDGPQMVLASMAVALVVALVAQIATGELKTSDLQGGAGPLLLEFGKLWAIQQAVFALLKDSVPALTTKPILTPPPVKPAA